ALLAALPARLRQIAPAVSRKQFCYHLTPAGQVAEIEDLPKRQKVLQSVLAALKASSRLTESELDEISSTARKAAKALVELGFASCEQVLILQRQMAIADAAEPQLNDEQLQAVQRINAQADQYQPWLINGITG
ncbi:MAG: primosomal protein N', partial [Methylotenera sp.]